MKKILAMLLVACVMMTFASFPVSAAEAVATTITPTDPPEGWNSPLKGTHSHKAAANAIGYAVDGNNTTHFTSDQYNGKGYNLIFELGTPGTLDTLKIEWGGTAWGHMPAEEYTVYVAGDDCEFVEILSYTGLYDPDAAAAAYPGRYEKVSGSKGGGRMDVTIAETGLNVANVRYIKIRVNKSTYNASIREISATVIPANSEPEVAVLKGANIRLESDSLSAGLRFAASVSKVALGIEGDWTYDAEADYEFGMYLLPEDMLANGETLTEYLENGEQAALKVVAKKFLSQTADTVEYTAVLTDIPEDAYARDIVAVPYVFEDGKYTYYDEMTRSYKNVALVARETTYSDDEIAKITDATLKAQMQAVADELDKIVGDIVKTKTVVPSKTTVYSMGRTYNYNELLYAGAVYEYKFTGSVAGAKITKSSGDAVRFEVSIDGGDFVSYTTSDTNTNEYVFATDLNAYKEHTVRIMRASDIWAPKLTVNSIVVAEDATVVDNYSPDYDLKIEFVGDSITTGVKTSFFAQSYAYLTATALNANFNVVSRSGLGLHQNANNGSGGQLKSVYASVASGDGNYKYDYDPDLVVLNIGTNDGANVNKLDTTGKAEYRTAFKEKYVEMLEIIHEKNPNATILCTGGLMGDFSSVKTQVTEAVALFKAENPDAKVYCEFLSVANDISSDTSWHPGVAGHAKGAEQLIPIIKRIMNIQ